MIFDFCKIIIEFIVTKGYSKEAILYRWNKLVLPCFEKSLAPYEENADFRFNNRADFESEFLR
jgi:hypothetical protein